MLWVARREFVFCCSATSRAESRVSEFLKGRRVVVVGKLRNILAKGSTVTLWLSLLVCLSLSKDVLVSSIVGGFGELLSMLMMELALSLLAALVALSWWFLLVCAVVALIFGELDDDSIVFGVC